MDVSFKTDRLWRNKGEWAKSSLIVNHPTRRFVLSSSRPTIESRHHDPNTVNFPTTLIDDWAASITLTLGLMASASLIASLGGLSSAWAADVLRRSGRTGWLNVWTTTWLLMIALPFILHAAAWEATAGKFGWLTQTTTGGNLAWVAWIHGCHGTAIVGLVTFWATGRVPAAVLRTAELDSTPATVWWRVKLPIAMPWVIVSVMLVMVLAATEMSVVNLHSVRTIADQFYLFHAIDPAAAAVLMMVLVPTILGGPLWWMLRRLAGDQGWAAGDGVVLPGRSQPWNAACIAAAIFMILSLTVTCALPLFGLLIKAGHVVEIVDGRRVVGWSISRCAEALGEAPGLFGEEYLWTIQLAILTTLVTVPVAWSVARWGYRRSWVSAVLDSLAIFLFLIPGPLVGLFWTWLFSGDGALATMLATQTLVPTMLSVGCRSSVVAYFILRIGYANLDRAVGRSAQLDGSAWWRWWNVERPLLMPALVAAIIATLIVSSGDVPATLPVLPPGVTTVGTRLFGLLHSGARYQEASLAFWYSGGVLGIGLAGRWLIRRF